MIKSSRKDYVGYLTSGDLAFFIYELNSGGREALAYRAFTIRTGRCMMMAGVRAKVSLCMTRLPNQTAIFLKKGVRKYEC